MADTPSTPDAPDTLTSYSDPLYDRLEGVTKALGRKWWAIVLLAIAVGVVVVVLQQQRKVSPVADGANAYIQARGEEGIAELEAVATNDGILAEFRARAGLEAANRALRDKKPEDAERLLGIAKTQAVASQLRDLELTVIASQAAVAEQRGQLEDAEALYRQVADKTGTDLAGLNLVATIGVARVIRMQAEAIEDRAERVGLLKVAHESFSFAAARSVEGATTLTDYATFQRYDLERRYPELIGGEAPPAPEAAPEASPEGGATDESQKTGEDAAAAEQQPALPPEGEAAAPDEAASTPSE